MTTEAETPPPTPPWWRTEDGLAVLLGLAVVALGLGRLAGADLLGWAVAVKEWSVPVQAFAPAGKGFAGLGGWGRFPGATSTSPTPAA